MNRAERIAEVFHETYEQLAPTYGYRTRDESAVPWPEVPEPNRSLMVATVRALLDANVIRAAPSRSWRSRSGIPEAKK